MAQTLWCTALIAVSLAVPARIIAGVLTPRRTAATYRAYLRAARQLACQPHPQPKGRR